MVNPKTHQQVSNLICLLWLSRSNIYIYFNNILLIASIKCTEMSKGEFFFWGQPFIPDIISSFKSYSLEVLIYHLNVFSPAALVSEPKWLKQSSGFITSGQCNYLGSGHVTEINMTQSTQPLTLIHDKVRCCLSIERSGLLDFASLLLFDLLLGHCNIIKEPLFYKKGK